MRLLAKNLALTRTYLRWAVLCLCIYTVLYGVTQWLQAGRGLSPLDAGLLLLPMSAIGAVMARPVSQRNLLRTPLVAAAVACLAGSAGVLALTTHTPIAWIVVVSLLFGVAIGAGASANQTALYTQVAAGQIGTASGLLRTFGYLGSIASSAIIAITFRTHVSDHGLHVTGTIMVAVSALALILVVADRHLMSLPRARSVRFPGVVTDELPVPGTLPAVIGVRGARHNNLRDIDVDVPLWRMVAVVGVSGSGKTSLAMGTLYAEGMQRFLDSLSTYSRRRLSQAQRPDVDRIEHLPPALALRQRPPIPGPRSTVGTMSEVLNVLRLMMSRLGSHRCPNGHMVEPSMATQREEIICPVCGAHFEHPSAESFAFNSYGACPACQGLGVRSEVDVGTLVPDPDKTIADGAVLPWNSGGRRLSMYAAGELGVRLDVPYKELTDREKDIVLHGEPVKRQVTLSSGRNGRTVQLSVNYDNAVAAVERSLRSDNERTRRLVQRFVVTRVCSVCHGTRLRPEALTSRLGGRNLAEISALGLDELRRFTAGLPAGLPAELSRMTTGLLAELDGRLTPLLDVGLGYLTLDRAGASLSTGERQRIELTSTVRASTTGMLYVLDEPSVGLHPSNVAGLLTTITALVGNGNSVVVVEHERELIRAADWIIELGPGPAPTAAR